ncbi:MAG TPA: HAMP domain-containing sensor histidine kinase [Kofleriaceae bacterium]|nr:HAMP domain-containing sensor histidine kinase [Kofleriaceae bacterium]
MRHQGHGPGYGHWRRHHRPPWQGRLRPPGPRMGCPEQGAFRPWWRMHAGLHRRIFFGFGAAIALSWLMAAGFLYVTGGRARPIVLIPVAAVLWVASGAIAWRLIRPLLQVIRVARDIGDGKLKSRLELGRMDGELGVLSESINDMAARIERQLADQRELLAAVSHEIRTPLGHMRILLETALARGADPVLVADLELEVLEVDRLVGQLLAGSRLDFDAMDRRQLDCGELAALALERAGIDHDRLDVSVEGARVTGDPTLLARALANLIDNAQGHGGGLTCLRVRAGERAGNGAGSNVAGSNGAGGAGNGAGEVDPVPQAEVVFEVEDGGPGFNEGEIDRIFESFFRGERRGHGSLGLGLALVKRIATAHNGRAWAENRQGGGARLAFSLPQAPG